MNVCFFFFSFFTLNTINSLHKLICIDMSQPRHEEMENCVFKSSQEQDVINCWQMFLTGW